MDAPSSGVGLHPSPAELLDEARSLLETGSKPRLEQLQSLAGLLRSPDPAEATLGAKVVGLAATADDTPLAEGAREILRAAAASGAVPVARRALQLLATADSPDAYRRTLKRALDVAPAILDDETIAILAGKPMRRDMVEVFAALGEALLTGGGRPEAVEGMVRLIVAFGATHPSWYRRLRLLLTRGILIGSTPELRERAGAAREELEGAFRRWLGPAAHIAVAPETGEEYGWDDVVAFDEKVPGQDRHRLLVAIKHSPLVREAVLLLYDGATVELGDILPGGIWIQAIGEGHGKSVYRVTVQVRGGARYEIALNLVSNASREAQRDETDHLMLCDDGRADPVVERFGGYWPNVQLWTEELIPGDNLATTLDRLANRPEEQERFTGFWPYAAWSAMAAFVRFWHRTGRRTIVADPGPHNVFVPLHDYHASARLLSIAERATCTSPAHLLQVLHEHMVKTTEERRPVLRGHASWDIVFSSFLEASGEEEGLRLLHAARSELDSSVDSLLESFLESVSRRGFLPLPLFFAIKRYARWRRLNPNATPEASAQTVHELFATYGLAALEEAYPETRARFFRETVLAEAPQELARGLESLIQNLRLGTIQPVGLGDAIAAVRARLQADDTADFYLARLSLPHLKPADRAGFALTSTSGAPASDVVVTVRDVEGTSFHIRHALSPGEVEVLHRIFGEESLPVEFSDRHRFLLAVTESGRVAGGLFYEIDPAASSAHMDKIVVAYRFRNNGLATALMDELANRLLATGIGTLTTGFFRPQFFYRHGFHIDPRHAGLVKDLRAGMPASD